MTPNERIDYNRAAWRRWYQRNKYKISEQRAKQRARVLRGL